MNNNSMKILLIYCFLLISVKTEFDKLVFEENFEGKTLNLSKWEYDLGNGDNGWGNRELEYYRKSQENIYIENNQLHIKSKLENYGNMKYTSAKITTKHTFQFTYGYVEAKIKLPIGKGIWPAFWMLGANIDDVNWPECGEIDILEAVNKDQKILNTLHWKDENSNQYQNYGLDSEIEKREEFHKYGLNWTEEEIIMYIDDRECFKKNLNEIKSKAFNKPFYLILNLAVGGDLPGFEIDDSIFPLEMVIDYIKIYQTVENYNYQYLKHLIFYDDFDGKELDRTKWAYDIGVGKDGWGTFQKQYHTSRKDNIFLSDSYLYIRAKKEKYKKCEYTSGRLTTRYNMRFLYGIIETKIKFPSVDGVSPGLWLSGLLTNNNWPKCGEIDALIGTDNNNKINSGCIWGDNASYFRSGEVDLTKFNEYTIIWDKTYITIYANDLEIYRIKITPEDLIAFHSHFYLNLNVLVGGYTVNKKIDNSAFPVDMIVDSIKVYQYEENNIIDTEVHPCLSSISSYKLFGLILILLLF